ncbi:hypothetical protein TRVL_06070 [Trypanosoma vivax]|nr:hypothetical protein TRVL_06070 [Trypanosoma vivax]
MVIDAIRKGKGGYETRRRDGVEGVGREKGGRPKVSRKHTALQRYDLIRFYPAFLLQNKAPERDGRVLFGTTLPIQEILLQGKGMLQREQLDTDIGRCVHKERNRQ